MRATVQRVASAEVAVDGEVVSSIGEGLFVLLGVGREDGPDQADRLASRISRLRIFDDGQGRMGENLGDREILCVSQFTLYADLSRGNRPGFGEAAEPEQALPLYERVCELLDCSRGVFGADMKIAVVLDGPVTLLLQT